MDQLEADGGTSQRRRRARFISNVARAGPGVPNHASLRVQLHDSSTEGAGNAYPLPPGWSDGEEVTVIGFDHGYVRVLGDGKEATVFIVNIDFGVG